MNEEKYIISACLIGIRCRYDGKSKTNNKILELVKEGRAIPVCPEQLGGLTTPRAASEITKDRRVVNIKGTDVTNNFYNGAKEVLELAQKLGIKKAILKSKSPSCGLGRIYDGTFTNRLIEGNGILVDLLLKNNIEVISSEEYEGE